MATYPLSLKPGIILVDAVVVGPKNERIVRMILDTGASYTIIDYDVLIDVGYNPYQVLDVRSIITPSAVEHSPFFRIKALSALGHTMKGIEICAHSLPPTLPGRGLLGLNFLRHFNLHLRFLDQILEISKHSERFRSDSF